MNPLRYLFPLLMLLGLAVSAFVIVGALSISPADAPRTPLSFSTAPSPDRELAAQGRDLFLAKGCVVCHRHAGVEQARASMGDFDFADAPNLTRLKLDAAYLARWLDDPQALKPDTTMPNLNLSDSEIRALSAFLLQDGTAAP